MKLSAAERGFTLVEVMVALVIAAVLLPTLLMAYGSQADGIGYLREKSVAHWVAANKLTEMRIQVRRSGQMFTGKRDGVSEMAGREWSWEITSAGTTVENFMRVSITVAGADTAADADPLYTLVGYLALPPQALAGGEGAREG